LTTAALIAPTGQACEFAYSKLVECCVLKSVRPLWQTLVCRLEYGVGFAKLFRRSLLG